VVILITYQEASCERFLKLLIPLAKLACSLLCRNVTVSPHEITCPVSALIGHVAGESLQSYLGQADL